MRLCFILLIFLSGCASISDTKIYAFPKCVNIPPDETITIENVEEYCGPYVSISFKFK